MTNLFPIAEGMKEDGWTLIARSVWRKNRELRGRCDHCSLISSIPFNSTSSGRVIFTCPICQTESSKIAGTVEDADMVKTVYFEKVLGSNAFYLEKGQKTTSLSEVSLDFVCRACLNCQSFMFRGNAIQPETLALLEMQND